MPAPPWRFHRLAKSRALQCQCHHDKAGAEDFLIKPVSSDQLLPALNRAVSRHEIARGQKAKLDMVRACIARLTPREREVFELIVRGQTNEQAGTALGCTERTIKAHRQRVMEKMKVRSMAELVSLAERVGVFMPGAPPMPLWPLADLRGQSTGSMKPEGRHRCWTMAGG